MLSATNAKLATATQHAAENRRKVAEMQTDFETVGNGVVSTPEGKQFLNQLVNSSSYLLGQKRELNKANRTVKEKEDENATLKQQLQQQEKELQLEQERRTKENRLKKKALAEKREAAKRNRRLREGVEPLVAQGLPAKMRPAPSPVPPRQPVAIPSEQSRELTGKHVARQFDAFRELLQLTGGGVFRLPPLPSEAEDRASTPRQWRRRQPNRREEGMMGQEFADEDVWWKVLSCEWSEEYECIIVYYYDLHWAEDEKLTEEQLKGDLEHDCVQFSKVDEVTKWINVAEA